MTTTDLVSDLPSDSGALRVPDPDLDPDFASAALAAALDGPLVSTQWLADHLGADGLVIVDATVVPSRSAEGGAAYRSGLEEFVTEGHIPGAVFAEVLDRFSDPAGRFPFTRPDAEAFAAASAALGIRAGTTVVVYDAAVGQWAARLWYLLRSFGHDRVAVLDGGAVKWRAEGRPVERGPAATVAAADVTEPPGTAAEGTFVARELPGFWVETADVAAIVAGVRTGTLVCGTPPRDFAARHIPGSVSAPAVRLVDRESNAVLPAAELRAVFADVLEAPGPIVAYCGAGIAAAADALALALLGRDDVLLYDGSLSEWTADPAAPVASAA
ncbi:MAG: sulfurtransferase [Leifsonia sp.]|nr:sulfurtransferase [Leifsonia sp.]